LGVEARESPAICAALPLDCRDVDDVTEENPSEMQPTANAPETSPRALRFYRPELDILRFVAFLAVFIHHGVPQKVDMFLKAGLSPGASIWIISFVKSGGLGVDLFFVISSYLITELFIREHERYGKVTISAFYLRRALRIWPLYYGFLLAMTLGPFGVRVSGASYTLAFALFLGNWACAFWGYPLGPIAPLWSVSIEEQFYVCWPLLIRAFGIRQIHKIGFAMILTANVVRTFLYFRGVGHPGVWCNTLARLDPIAAGALIAHYLKGSSGGLSFGRRTLYVLGGFALWLLACRYCGYSGADSLETSGYAGAASLLFYPIACVGASLMVLGTLASNPLPSTRLVKGLTYLGKISYGLYVFHLLSLALAGEIVHLQGIFYIAGQLTVGLALTVSFSIISYETVEKFFLRLKERLTRVPSRPV
jgi:peptidoglycan/LPS O-acetylase OafA/YrhL